MLEIWRGSVLLGENLSGQLGDPATSSYRSVATHVVGPPIPGSRFPPGMITAVVLSLQVKDTVGVKTAGTDRER
ncbi:MAG: hypothetical protein CM1200mP14_18460 [Gammaproteobacteria bacterium]|nr:MAG: hypothetical protein CM1200mP14_18460 [Gammaproteobacteria bacterium]